MITWDLIRDRLQESALKRGEWCGLPLPSEQCALVAHDRFPYDIDALNEALGHRNNGGSDNIEFINAWWSERRQQIVYVYRMDGKIRCTAFADQGWPHRLFYWMNSLDSSTMLNPESELIAVQTLKEMITPHQFRTYVISGTFLETSKRSKVVYMFRKARPTIALSFWNPDHATVLTALCLHPLAYYKDSYAGAMVPTDDVIAHLVMMRGDERKFWSKANHHPPWAANSGI